MTATPLRPGLACSEQSACGNGGGRRAPVSGLFADAAGIGDSRYELLLLLHADFALFQPFHPTSGMFRSDSDPYETANHGTFIVIASLPLQGRLPGALPRLPRPALSSAATANPLLVTGRPVTQLRMTMILPDPRVAMRRSAAIAAATAPRRNFQALRLTAPLLVGARRLWRPLSSRPWHAPPRGDITSSRRWRGS